MSAGGRVAAVLGSSVEVLPSLARRSNLWFAMMAARGKEPRLARSRKPARSVEAWMTWIDVSPELCAAVAWVAFHPHVALAL